MLRAQRSGQFCGRAWKGACRDSFSICASLQPKLPQIYADPGEFGKAKFAILRGSSRKSRLRAAHVGTGARVDLNGFALLDEQWDVDGLAGLKLCRFGNVAGGIAPKAFC